MDEAIALFHQSIEIVEEKRGKGTFEIAATLGNLANVYLDQGKVELAEKTFQNVLTMYQSTEPDNPTIGTIIGNLGCVYTRQRKFDKAEEFLLRSLKIDEINLPATHPNRAVALNNLGTLYRKWCKFELSENYYQRALNIFEQIFGPDHQEVATILDKLAETYQLWGKTEEAYTARARAKAIRSRLNL